MIPEEAVLAAIRQLVRSENEKREHRINQLEHRLKSFVDFMENPHIAGDTFAALNSYTWSLVTDTKRLLENEA
jgi:hypothetical protein